MLYCFTRKGFICKKDYYYYYIKCVLKRDTKPNRSAEIYSDRCSDVSNIRSFNSINSSY